MTNKINLLESEFISKALEILYQDSNDLTKDLSSKLVKIRQLTETIAHKVDPNWNWSVARLDEFAKGLSNKNLDKKAKFISKSIAKEYAEFCVMRHLEGLPILELDDYVKQLPN
jgi:hypothetical protein